MSNILITGGAGYIGSILTPLLLERGHTVCVFDNFMFGAQSLLGVSDNPQLELIHGDVRDTQALRKVIPGKDYVIHLAAIVGYPACSADPHLAETTNVEGTRNVVGAMQKGQRLIFASTGSTYGKVEDVATEDTPIAPLTLYGKNKRDCEDIVKASDLEHVILRFATVFGSSPRMRLDLLVNDFVYQAIHNRQIILFEGHFRRTFLHCRDAADIYPFVMDHFDEMVGNSYNVGSNTMNYTKREVALRIQDHVDYYLHEADVGTDPDQRDYEVDYSRLHALGYKSKIDLEQGIQELVRILSVLKVANPMRNA